MSKIPNSLVNGIAAVVALAGGLCIGVLDLQTSEVVMTLGVVFVFNMLLGAVAPRGGWYWPGITAVSILFLNWFPKLAGLASNPYLDRTFWSYLLLAILLSIAGLAGMLFGVVVRRTFHVYSVNP